MHRLAAINKRLVYFQSSDDSIGIKAPPSFAPLRLCVRLYWRSVSTGHDREIATTGGCPSNMLRMVPLLLRNA
jgi:hypothetical protein